MICTDAAGLGLFSGRRVAVPAGLSVKFVGAQMKPANALAATTAGEAEINERVTIAHPAFEIAIRGADCRLALLHETATESNARAAARRQRNCAGTYQRLPVTT